MLLGIPLPDFGAGARCTLLTWHARAGDRLEPGAALADLRVDLSAGVVEDCPPVTTCRIVLREAAWLRRPLVAAGELVPPAAPLALVTSAPDSPLDGAPARALRCTVAAILLHDDWWGGDG